MGDKLLTGQARKETTENKRNPHKPVIKNLMTVQEIQKIIKEKVIGKIEPAHDIFNHHYKFVETGTIVDSVTTKIIIEREHLRRWYAKMALEKFIGIMGSRGWDTWQEAVNDKSLMQACILAAEDNRDSAGRTGTQAHDTIDRYCQSWIDTNKQPTDITSFLLPEHSFEVTAAVRSAEKLFKKNSHIIPLASEILVGVETKSVTGAGTLDMLVWNSETKEIELWDWKSSRSIDKYIYSIQVATYKKFFEMMTGLKIGKIKIMKLSKKYDDFDIHILKNPHTAFKAFKAISYVYDWKKSEKDKLINDKKIINL